MKKSTLYGPRLKGDVDLGLEPSRVPGTVKDWARMDFPGGLVPGGTVQEIGAATTAQNYRIGTRRVQDERVYRYCHAEASIGCDKAYAGAQNWFDYNITEALGDCISGVTVGTKAAATYFLVAGDDNDLHIEDFFEGGWAVVTVGSVLHMFRIRASSAGGFDDDEVTLTLWDPLIAEVAAGSTIQVYPSIYGKVQREWAGGDARKATVCVPNLVVPADEYFWGQTWGPCYGVAPEPFPKGDYESEMVFSYQGGLYLRTSALCAYQRAGYKLINYETDESGYWILYMLTLSP